MLKTTELIKTKTFELAIYQRGSTDSDKLAIVLPGKLDTKDYPHMKSHVNFLARKGYLALSFDPPGTWESKGRISKYNMTNYFKAIKELIEYFGNKPTLLVGHSMGGGIAALAGARIPEVKNFICLMAAVDYTDRVSRAIKWKDKGIRISKRDTPEGYVEDIVSFEMPYSFIEDLRNHDIINDLKICKKPKLFVVGEKDESVKPEEVKHAFKISSEPKQLRILDSDHDYRKNKEMIGRINQIIDKFISSTPC